MCMEETKADVVGVFDAVAISGDFGGSRSILLLNQDEDGAWLEAHAMHGFPDIGLPWGEEMDGGASIGFDDRAMYLVGERDGYVMVERA